MLLKYLLIIFWSDMILKISSIQVKKKNKVELHRIHLTIAAISPWHNSITGSLFQSPSVSEKSKTEGVIVFPKMFSRDWKLFQLTTHTPKVSITEMIFAFNFFFYPHWSKGFFFPVDFLILLWCSQPDLWNAFLSHIFYRWH